MSDGSFDTAIKKCISGAAAGGIDANIRTRETRAMEIFGSAVSKLSFSSHEALHSKTSNVTLDKRNLFFFSRRKALKALTPSMRYRERRKERKSQAVKSTVGCKRRILTLRACVRNGRRRRRWPKLPGPFRML